jgi:pyruvate/2-oxoglutarate dehydrogenase complex dihydrolipoamide acyltransferase (E2) component
MIPLRPLMETFLIDVPMPSMGATVNELTVVSLKIQPGATVAKGDKIAELESDKSIFEFEAPCTGVVRAILARAGDVKPSGTSFLHMETADATLSHLKLKAPGDAGTAPVHLPPSALVWTPRATKLLEEAGLTPERITDIAATGPGGRVSGDDVTRYLAQRKA